MKKADYKVLKRYFEKKEQQGDKELIQSWFADRKADTDVSSINRQLWDEPIQKKDLEGFDSNIILSRILNELKLKESYKLPKIRRLSRRRLIYNLSIAASIFLVLSLFSWLWIIRPDSTITFATNSGGNCRRTCTRRRW